MQIRRGCRGRKIGPLDFLITWTPRNTNMQKNQFGQAMPTGAHFLTIRTLHYIWNSLNCITFFTQPPFSYDARLVSGQLCLLTIPQGNPVRLSIVSYTTDHLPLKLCPTGIEPSPIQHFPVGSRLWNPVHMH